MSGHGRGQNRPPATAQPDAAESVSLAEASEDDFVSIFQKFPLLSRRQRDWILAPRGEFQQASARRFARARNRSAGQQITRAQIAAIARVMRQHRRHGPVHVAKIASAQNHRIDASLAHPHRQQRNF